MTAATVAPSVGELFTQLRQIMSQLADAAVSAALAAVSGPVLQDGHRTLETARRLLDAVELRVINAEIEQQVPFEHGCANPASYVAGLMQISPAQARTRVRDAAATSSLRPHVRRPVSPQQTRRSAQEADHAGRGGGVVVKELAGSGTTDRGTREGADCDGRRPHQRVRKQSRCPTTPRPPGHSEAAAHVTDYHHTDHTRIDDSALV